jgi:hypothetical protein
MTAIEVTMAIGKKTEIVETRRIRREVIRMTGMTGTIVTGKKTGTATKNVVTKMIVMTVIAATTAIGGTAGIAVMIAIAIGAMTVIDVTTVIVTEIAIVTVGTEIGVIAATMTAVIGIAVILASVGMTDDEVDRGMTEEIKAVMIATDVEAQTVEMMTEHAEMIAADREIAVMMKVDAKRLDHNRQLSQVKRNQGRLQQSKKLSQQSWRTWVVLLRKPPMALRRHHLRPRLAAYLPQAIALQPKVKGGSQSGGQSGMTPPELQIQVYLRGCRMRFQHQVRYLGLLHSSRYHRWHHHHRCQLQYLGLLLSYRKDRGWSRYHSSW